MRSAIAWMAENPVAANLLMMLLIVGGIIFSGSIKQEIFPEIELDSVSVAVVYPGAGPEEVEQGVCLPIEEAVFGIEGIKEISCSANEGAGVVTAELIEGEDVARVLQDIKSEVDRIQTFPDDAEDPTVSQVLPRREVLSLAVYGHLSELALREQAELIRDDLLQSSKITQVELAAVRPYEISIEVKEENLRKYGISLEQVATRVREASIDIPGGSVKTRGGEILLRTKEKRYQGSEYEKISILSFENGGELFLGDIAEVKDSFEDVDEAGFFDGKRTAFVKIYRVGKQTPIEISDEVKKYIADKQLAPGVSLSIWNDSSEMFVSRMNLLLRNAALGLILVMVILGLFLEIKLAFWVTMGIPISFLGAMFFMPSFDVSINMISLFAFILALGIVVDDAIVVGENIYEERSKGGDQLAAAKKGTYDVGVAVIFSVLTSVAAFMPMLFASGVMGKFMRVIPIIVISVLLLSLVESLFILPAHLAHSKVDNKKGLFKKLEKIREKFSSKMQGIVNGPYLRFLEKAVKARYLTLSYAIGFLILSFAVLAAGYVNVVHMPNVDDVIVTAKLNMPVGTAIEDTKKISSHINEQAFSLISDYEKEYGEGEVYRNIYSLVGASMQNRGHGAKSRSSGSHMAQVAVFLTEGDSREFSSKEFAEEWRKRVGEIPGAESLTFTSDLISVGESINIQLEHEDYKILRKVSDRLKDKLRSYSGVSDIADNLSNGKKELTFKLKPRARTLGITEASLGRQIRAAFYGAEAVRLQRGREELRVMIRYPEEERVSLADIDTLRIRTASGAEVAFSDVAETISGTGYNQIKRRQLKRVANVTASVDKKNTNAKEIISELIEDYLPGLLTSFPGLSYSLEGEEQERRESTSSLMRGFLFVLLLIYALLAIPFKSYIQPVIVMFAIPFGLVGAVLGHFILGFDVSLLSLFGILALAGVVVNDSLVLVDYINRERRAGGTDVFKIVCQSGCRRFRPVVLTSLTTFFGLMPIILEKSLQAQFLIPMAISLGFGIIFATGITLVLIPSFYMIVEDVRGRFVG